MFCLSRGDCAELIKTIPDNSVDMILTDLPYQCTRNKWDIQIPLDVVWGGCNRVITDNGVMAFFCNGLFMAELMLSNRKLWRYNLIWRKQQGSDFLNANRKPLSAHEEIAIFYKHQPVYNKQMWESPNGEWTAYHSANHTENYGSFKACVTSGSAMRNPLSVLDFQYDNKERGLHPTQKPVALCEWLIKTYTNEGQTVLDLCMGSGSVGVAAVNTGRNFIGFELNEKYFDIAERRINAQERLYEQSRTKKIQEKDGDYASSGDSRGFQSTI